jgi:hypothetical protein
MSRRDEWSQVKESMFAQATKATSVEERETIPEVACGICKNFSENAYASDGRGTCRALKIGSNISVDPPVYKMEGETGMVGFFNTDAYRCSHFVRMDLIDKDGNECADPAYRRAQRQMEKL